MEETPKFFTANCLTIYRITGNYADPPVIVDVKLQNLKANHNLGRQKNYVSIL